jgi:hypothetical protein
MDFLLHHHIVEIDIESNNYPSPSTGEGRGEGVKKFLPPTFILPRKRGGGDLWGCRWARRRGKFPFGKSFIP